jgi:hypothetical protein
MDHFIGPAIFIGFWLLVAWFRKNRPWPERVNYAATVRTQENEPPSEVYVGLRDRALHVTREQIDPDHQFGAHRVFGIVMDLERPGGTATLVAFISGDASIYTSRGGGILGAGEHEEVRRAAFYAVRKSGSFLNKASRAQETPLPNRDGVQIYLLTDDGLFVLRDEFRNMMDRRSRWVKLYVECHKLVSAMRVLDASVP